MYYDNPQTSWCQEQKLRVREPHFFKKRETSILKLFSCSLFVAVSLCISFLYLDVVQKQEPKTVKGSVYVASDYRGVNKVFSTSNGYVEVEDDEDLYQNSVKKLRRNGYDVYSKFGSGYHTYYIREDVPGRRKKVYGPYTKQGIINVVAERNWYIQ